MRDDGRGLPEAITPRSSSAPGHMGLAGMRERIGALGGTVTVRRPAGATACGSLEVPLPVQAHQPGLRQ